MLKEPFSKEEVFIAFLDLRGNKVLGSDGFPMLFGSFVGIL